MITNIRPLTFDRNRSLKSKSIDFVICSIFIRFSGFRAARTESGKLTKPLCVEGENVSRPDSKKTQRRFQEDPKKIPRRPNEDSKKTQKRFKRDSKNNSFSGSRAARAESGKLTKPLCINGENVKNLFILKCERLKNSGW